MYQDVLQFFSLPSNGGETLKSFSKIFSVVFTYQYWYLCEFLDRKKSKKYLHLCLFVTLSGILKIFERKQETVKGVICHECTCKVDNVFKPIVTNTFISFEKSGQLVLPRQDILFLISQRLPSSYKIGLDISRKTWGMKFIFCLQINITVLYKLIVSLWVCIVRCAQSTQQNKLTVSLQYVRENIKNEVDFQPFDKRQRFL